MKRKKKSDKKKKVEKPGFLKIVHPTFKIQKTFGQKAADVLTRFAGSWAFIILVTLFIFAWVYLNVTAYVNNWDPWPFIILNLCLSCLAALQAPIILMSQNRENQRDRLRAQYDYAVNRRAEKEIQEIKKILMRRKR